MARKNQSWSCQPHSGKCQGCGADGNVHQVFTPATVKLSRSEETGAIKQTITAPPTPIADFCGSCIVLYFST
jgi:hypothetical protein